MKNKVIIISVLSILLLISSLNLVMAEELNQNEEQKLGFWGRIGAWFSGEVDELDQAACSNPIDFFHEYTIALNDYHAGQSWLDMGNINLENEVWYSYQEDYYYEFAEDYLNEGKEQVNEAEEYFKSALKKFNEIKLSAPNEFYREEIDNRIKQTEISITLSENLYSLLDYQSIELYEVTYGSESKAEMYFDKYNNLIPEFNKNLEQLSDISNKIDLAWGKDWYPEFQESEIY